MKILEHNENNVELPDYVRYVDGKWYRVYIFKTFVAKPQRYETHKEEMLAYREYHFKKEGELNESN